jgi:predicted nucleic acid-binding protein
MNADILIYMDCCCLNRPNDDQTQDKIRIESDAIIAILFKCSYNSWKLIGSDVLEYEIMKTPDLNKRNKVLELYKIKKENIAMNDIIVKRANEIQKYGIKPMDSLHFASAEYRNVNVLLTVDKDFIFNSEQINTSLRVVNPINWFMEEIGND